VWRGNPGKRRLNAQEPQPQPASETFDVPPVELQGDALASAEWARVAPMLRLCGLVSEAERSALTALCQQWSRYLEAQVKVRELGMIVKKPSGIPVVNPYMAVADKALTHCLKL
jgi:P27 family predicted phage terminase small subunit